jgi:hypothetical protein
MVTLGEERAEVTRRAKVVVTIAMGDFMAIARLC